MLRPYQGRAAKQIVHTPYTALFIDMGLGKTVIALTAIADILVKKPSFKWLVIAPIKVCETVWRQEAKKWEHTQHITFSLVRGNPKERAFALAKDANVYLINPENVVWLREYIRGDWDQFDGLIIDESSLFKDRKSKRFRKLTNYGSREGERSLIDGSVMYDADGHMIRKPPHRFRRTIIMTGTPRPQSMMNLWSQIFILDHGKRLHREFDTFLSRYFHMAGKVTKHIKRHEINSEENEERPHNVILDEAPQRIHELLADITVELDAADYKILPAIIPSYHYVDIPASQREKYDILERDALIELSTNTAIAVNGGVKQMMCWQFANGAMYTLGKDSAGQRNFEVIYDGMLDELDSLVDQLDANVIIPYAFKSDLARILARHPDATILPTRAEKVVDRWNEGKIKKLLLHPKSGSHGLNIQFGGNHIIWFGSLWSNEQYRQTNRRLARPGQPCGEGVFTHHILARKTIHELQLASVMERGDEEQRFRSALRNYQKAKRLGIYTHELYQ